MLAAVCLFPYAPRLMRRGVSRLGPLLLPLLAVLPVACVGLGSPLCDYAVDDDGLYVDAFEASVFEKWDADDDGLLDAAEFEAGLAEVGWDEAWTADVAAWDADGDARLGADEFGAGFEEAGVWDAWDADDDGLLDTDPCRR